MESFPKTIVKFSNHKAPPNGFEQLFGMHSLLSADVWQLIKVTWKPLLYASVELFRSKSPGTLKTNFSF
jgi:hypothetical protein